MNAFPVDRVQGRPGRISLVSECPRCRHERAQWYSPGALQRLFSGGHPVEAYCTMCDEYWRVSAYERAGLAANLQAIG